VASSDPKFSIERIEYWIKWLSESFASGKWDSHSLGRGFNFQEIVPYEQAPDPGLINWPATLGSYPLEIQVTQYREERNVPVYVLGDLTRSMFFGTDDWLKQERLALIAALLAFSVGRSNDRLRFIGFSDKAELDFTRSGGDAFPALLAEEILRFYPTGGGFGGLVQAAASVPAYPKALVVIVSDFLGNLSQVEESIQPLAHRHDLLPIVLWDRAESAWSGGSLPLPVCDAETGRLIDVFNPKAALARNMAALKRKITELFQGYDTEPAFLDQVRESDVDALISAFFSKRLKAA